MKKVLILFTVLCSTLFLTGCLDEQDYKYGTITKEIATKWITNTAGSYTGAFYLTNLSTGNNDGYKVSWTITANDSVITIKDFPVSALAQYASGTDSTLVAKAENKTLTAVLHPFNGGYEQQYSFYMFPTTETLDFSVVNNETTYPVSIAFGSSLTLTTTSNGYATETSYYPIALYTLGGVGPFEANIVLSSISVNGQKYDISTIATIYGVKSN